MNAQDCIDKVIYGDVPMEERSIYLQLAIAQSLEQIAKSLAKLASCVDRQSSEDVHVINIDDGNP